MIKFFIEYLSGENLVSYLLMSKIFNNDNLSDVSEFPVVINFREFRFRFPDRIPLLRLVNSSSCLFVINIFMVVKLVSKLYNSS